MTYYTPEEINPSEQILNNIRQVAYAYQDFKQSGTTAELWMN